MTPNFELTDTHVGGFARCRSNSLSGRARAICSAGQATEPCTNFSPVPKDRYCPVSPLPKAALQRRKTTLSRRRTFPKAAIQNAESCRSLACLFEPLDRQQDRPRDQSENRFNRIAPIAAGVLIVQRPFTSYRRRYTSALFRQPHRQGRAHRHKNRICPGFRRL